MLAVGTEVGGFRIDGILGRGGMGVVYEATQLSLGRTIALKVLANELSENEDFRTRFRREGRIQAGVDHDHIVTVYEAGELDEGLYIAMRLIRGPNLKELIRSGTLDPARAVRILGPVAEALDTAHEAGLVHRDIKPQNILVGKRDHGYLADFGLTRGAADTALTKTGHFVGTLDYVAPEQLEGKQPSAESDLYALGAVAYECLTGEVPFPRPTEAAVLFAHMSESPPRPSERRPELPPAVDDVVGRAMAKDPAARPATALDLIAALTDALGDSAQSTGPVPGSAAEDAGTQTPPLQASDATRPAADTAVLDGPIGIPTQADARRPWGAEDALGEPEVIASVARAQPAAPPLDEWDRTDSTSPTGPQPAQRAAPRARTAPGRTAEPRRRVPARAVGCFGLFAVAAAAGALLGGGSEAPKRAPLETKAAKLSTPAGWNAATAPPVPGLVLRDARGLRPAAHPAAGGLGVGLSDGRGPSLLPGAMRAKFTKTPPREVVRLGALEAYRYRDVRPTGAAGPVTLFTLPTREGVLTITCSGAAADRRTCEGAAGTLELSGAAPLPLGPRTAYAQPVGAALKSLAQQRRAAANQIGAGTASSHAQFVKASRRQADAADRLHAAHRRAEQSIRRAKPGPLELPGHQQLTQALDRLAAGYSSLAVAARGRHRSAYNAARDLIRLRERALRNALETLRRAGYKVA